MKFTKFFRFSYKNILKPILFKFDPEDIHNIFIVIGNILGKFKLTRKITKTLFQYNNKSLNQSLFGINFENPIGLSAGFDYNGLITSITNSIGFGFESVGTVTFNNYDGNQKPRLLRLPKSKSLLVNKGFKNLGIEAISKLVNTKSVINPITGFSIGATNSKDCSTTNAQIEDILRSLKYLQSTNVFNKLKYIEINISCPNVLGSGALTKPSDFENLLKQVSELKLHKPIFVKFPLEIEWEEAKKLIIIMIKYKVSAIIIANLLKNRNYKELNIDEINNLNNQKGNFSGKPTFNLSNELISKVYKEFKDEIKIIGVGGIFTAIDAYEKIKRGASLVQLITGMIYEGPQSIGEINKGLTKLLTKDGYKNISQAIGTFHI